MCVCVSPALSAGWFGELVASVVRASSPQVGVIHPGAGRLFQGVDWYCRSLRILAEPDRGHL